ncbi:hypothetical protein MMC12_004487 [Toensbergia leucococca]|nr:hypothetical protein [Toensbergia leucococca]
MTSHSDYIPQRPTPQVPPPPPKTSLRETTPPTPGRPPPLSLPPDALPYPPAAKRPSHFPEWIPRDETSEK